MVREYGWGGYSLNLSDVYSVEYAWRVSVFAGGSPGWDDRDDLRVRGDFTGEGVVDWDDLALMIGDWLEDDSRADIYPMPPGNDGVVNLADLAVLARHWLEGTAP